MVTSAPINPEKAPSKGGSKTTPELGRFRVVIIGGGTGGVSVAARLANAGQHDVAIIEPSEKHFYQPLWTLVGAGIAHADESVRDERGYIPEGCRWIKEHAAEIDPTAQTVTMRSGKKVGYDFLVVAPGIQLDWDKVPGLREALKTEGVSSNYVFELAPKTWRLIENFRGGTALFNHPSGAIKCAGAPQKIAYLAADYFRRSGVAGRSKIVFASAAKAIFGVKEFRVVLDAVVERYAIDTRYSHDLIEVRPEKKEAVFRLQTGDRDEKVTVPYDIFHAVPHQSAPDFIKQSPIADSQGWAKADKHTLQNPDYPNVFCIGDASSLPTSRTGSAIRRQAPVLVHNLLAVMNGKEPASRYDGYASCPLVTAYDKLVLAEFDYDGKPTPSIPFINTRKERYDMYLLKRYGLPFLYWNLMLRGRA
jgi:sulfide:quinone oxidoreductase